MMFSGPHQIEQMHSMRTHLIEPDQRRPKKIKDHPEYVGYAGLFVKKYKEKRSFDQLALNRVCELSCMCLD